MTERAEESPLVDGLRTVLAGRYEIERELGRGGMATVYLARDVRHKRRVAIKVLDPDLSASLGTTRFLREIETAAPLSHPHVVPVHDSGEAAGCLYYVMPYVDGDSLRVRLQREGALPLNDVLELTRDIADALDYAHEQGIIHRDIKPENVLLSRGHAVVADFGVARAVRQAAEGETGESLTQTGLAVGTPAYMSPEQAAGEREIDRRSDVYALCCVVYEMLTAAPPYTGTSAQQIAKRFRETAPPASARRSELPMAADTVLARALALAPSDRFATAGDFARALATALRGASLGNGNPPRGRGIALAAPWRRRTLGLTLAGAAVVAMAAWWAWSRRDDGGSLTTSRKMLVVLPFKNLGHSDDAYFADGVTEEVTSRLASVSGLGVISRTSADRYRGTTKPLKEIARELGVEYVLEGSVRWDRTADGAGRVRVTPQLIRVADDSHVWADQIDAELRDVFRVQSDVARRVAEALDVALRPAERRVIESTPTQNLEAYDHFLRGIAILRRADVAVEQFTYVDSSVKEFERAVALDGQFASAHAALARMLVWAWVGNHRPEVAERAKTHALEALRLEPESPDGHVALGDYYMIVQPRDLERALAQYRDAIRIRPSDPLAVSGTADVEWARGRWREALAGYEAASRLSPTDYGHLGYGGRARIILRDYEGAARMYEQAMVAEPDAPYAYLWRAHLALLSAGDTTSARAMVHRALDRVGAERLGRAYGWSDEFPWIVSDAVVPPELERLTAGPFSGDSARYFMFKLRLRLQRGDTARSRPYADTAIRVLTATVPQPERPAAQHASLALAHAVLGQRDAALREAKSALDLAAPTDLQLTGSKVAAEVARVHLVLGDRETALKQLERALESPTYFSPGLLRVDPAWTPLHDHPRLRSLINAPR